MRMLQSRVQVSLILFGHAVFAPCDVVRASEVVVEAVTLSENGISVQRDAHGVAVGATVQASATSGFSDAWKTVRAFGTVTSVNVRGDGISLEQFVEMASLESLEFLNLDGTQVPDEWLSSLKGHKRVKFIALSRSAGERSFELLSNVATLTSLTVNSSQMDDEAFSRVSRISNLAVIDIGSRCPISAKTIESLTECLHLQSVTVHRSLGDDAAAALARIHRLETVNVGSWRLTNSGVQSLGALAQLKRFVMPFGVTDENVGAFKNCTKLRYVDLESSNVSSVGLESFRNATGLSFLSLPAGVDSHGIRVLGVFPRLIHVTIRDAVIDDKMVDAILSCKHLTSLVLVRCRVVDGAIARLERENPRLTVH